MEYQFVKAKRDSSVALEMSVSFHSWNPLMLQMPWETILLKTAAQEPLLLHRVVLSRTGAPWNV